MENPAFQGKAENIIEFKRKIASMTKEEKQNTLDQNLPTKASRKIQNKSPLAQMKLQNLIKKG
jgi:hypothetical protein